MRLRGVDQANSNSTEEVFARLESKYRKAAKGR